MNEIKDNIIKSISKIIYEPKSINRFIVEFPEEFNILQESILKINKPKFKNNKWKNIKIELIDFIGPSTSKGLYSIIKLVKNNIDQKILFNIIIKSLDPVGSITEEWKIEVEKIKIINFGDLDYENDKFLKIYIVLKPSNCILL